MSIRTIILAAVASLSIAGTGLGQFWKPPYTELTATGGSSGDGFGSSVAIDGSTCVIGAPGGTSGAGSAYVFTNTSGTWSQVAELTTTGGASYDYFGSSVAIDGSTCVIGATGTDSGTGSAYVFTNTGGTWSQVQTLTATGGAIYDNFGDSIDLDGDTCVIGAYGTNSSAGSAYVFTNTGGTWSQVAELTATGGASNDYFGQTVAIDGSTCVIGAPGTDSFTGSAYVFTNTGGTWSQVAELTATGGASNDQFGQTVAIDGSTCVIGATGTGSAYVFTNTGGTWSQAEELTATGGASGNQFGDSVAIDGNTCVIGAWGTNSNTGSAYVFANFPSRWSQIAVLTAIGGASGDNFSFSVAIDGDTCVIGASGTDSSTGSAYVYDSVATGACCYDGLCFSITESECTAVGGSFTAEACSADTACPTPCSSDVDNDGDIDIQDLLQMLTDWGACP